MNTWNKIALLGGDRRQRWTAERLAARGAEVAAWGIPDEFSATASVVRTTDWHSAIRGAKAILLPLPVSTDGIRLNCGTASQDLEDFRLTYLLEAVDKDQPIFGGRFPPAFKEAASERGLRLFDYTEQECFQINNARPTAEGALEIALRELPTVLNQSKVAVIGYGRIGKILSDLLAAFGASVTVAARKQTDLTWIEVRGYTPLKIETIDKRSSLCKLGTDCRVIFNTVPYWLFDRSVLESLNPKTLFIDLASSPGGVDPQTAQDVGIRVIRALALPGKCAPERAGEIIADTVLGMLSKEGVVFS